MSYASLLFSKIKYSFKIACPVGYVDEFKDEVDGWNSRPQETKRMAFTNKFM
jgi:hypothetical protein